MSKTDLESLGEDTEGLANGLSKYASELKSLTGFDIMLDGSKDTYKDLYDIFDGLSQKWDQLSDTQRARVSEILGGTRQLQVISSILNNWGDAVGAYDDAMNSAGVSTKAYDTYLGGVKGHIGQFKASFEELSATLVDSGFVNEVINLGRVVIEFLNNIGKIINSVGGLKTVMIELGAVMAVSKWETIVSTFSKLMSVLKTGLAALEANPIIAAATAITGIIIGISQLIDYYNVTPEEAAQSLSSITNEYNAANDEINKLNEELSTTQDRIAALQSKGKLSLTESEELDRLNAQNNELQRKIDLLKEERAEKQKDKINTFMKATDSIDLTPDYAVDTKSGLDSYLRIVEQYKDKKEAYDKEFERMPFNIGARIGNWFNEQEYEEALKQYQKYSDLIKDQEYIIKANLTDEEKAYNQRLDIINDFIDKFQILNGGENAKTNAFNRAVDNWQFDKVVQPLQDLGRQGKVTAKMLNDEKYASFIDKLIEIGVINDKTKDSLELVASAFNLVGNNAEEAGNKIKSSIGDFGSQLTENLSSGLSQIDKLYADIIDKGDFDYDTLFSSDFSAKFGNLDSYDDFLNTISKYPNNINACQEAFNKLTSEYITHSGILQDVTDETRDLTIAYLEQNGVANAAKIVDNQLAANKEEVATALAKVTDETRNLTIAYLEQNGVEDAAEMVDNQLAFSKKKLEFETRLGTDATYEEIVAYMNEISATGEARKALSQLAISKFDVNKNVINTSADIDNLINLAKQAGATAKSLAALTEARAAYAEFEATIASISKENPELAANYASAMGVTAKIKIYNAMKGMEYTPVATSATYSGGSASNNARKSSGGGGSGSAGSAGSAKNEKNEETWFDKEYKKHQHLVKMEQETDEAYYKWLQEAMQKAYDSGIIELDDYRKYQEEVFDGLRNLFKDRLNDIEHEISKLDGFDGESKKIISLYKKLIAEVESEIAAARKKGLKDTDDYIQELENKLASYKKSIKELTEDATEDAKNSIDDLVEYRIDMIKQEIEDEKDALDKRLDNLKDFYDKQKKLLQDEIDEEKYLEDQKEKRKSVTNLEDELKQLEYDDSAWAQKRKVEIRKELADAKKELSDFERDHALDIALEDLDNQYDAQEAAIKAEVDALDKKINNPSALYNQALSEIKNNSANILDEMIAYNRKHGTGNDQDVIDQYNEAFKSLYNYKALTGTDYEGFKLPNSGDAKLDYKDGLNKSANGKWQYYKDGQVDTSFTGMAKNDYGWWYIKNGTLDTTYNGISKNDYGSWMMKNGKLDTTYNGMYKDSSGNWRYLQNGKVNDNYTGMGKNEYGWWYFENGKLNKNYTGMAKNEYGWWYFKNGKLDKNYTGNATNQYGTWYFENGRIKSQVGSGVSNKVSSISGNISSGSSSSSIKALQSALNALGYKGADGKSLSVDGVWGNNTSYALKQFQTKYGLTADGVAGEKTKAKFKALGYASGTFNASPGIHRVDESGAEYLFTSQDGSKYRIFSGGEKVLNSKATEFLYNFANNGKSLFDKILSDVYSNNWMSNLKPAVQTNEFVMGDIIINGSATNQTVSEIRREQRSAINSIMKKFNQLNK